jgi:hypothetical protein
MHEFFPNENTYSKYEKLVILVDIVVSTLHTTQYET